MRITIVILLVLVVIPFNGCLGISQEYNAIKSDLEKVLEIYKAEINDWKSQSKSYEEHDSGLKYPRAETITNYVEPTDSNVRNQALEIVTGNPSEINADADSWKIWSIFYWVSQNIQYVTDPKGQEYFQFAHETLQTKAGDCDDFSILLASMYESVGLDSALAFMDTDDEPGIDHVTCLVYWADDSQAFLDDENLILNKMRLTSPTEHIRIKYWQTEATHSLLGKYDEGIWITADGTMTEVRGLVGYVTHEPYVAIEIIDVGG